MVAVFLLFSNGGCFSFVFEWWLKRPICLHDRMVDEINNKNSQMTGRQKNSQMTGSMKLTTRSLMKIRSKIQQKCSSKKITKTKRICTDYQKHFPLYCVCFLSV
jgi:hypothetical protein